MDEKTILQKIKIAIVDDHELIREGMSSILRQHGVENVKKFSSASGLITRVRGGESFDIYSIDIELPDMNGFKLIDMIRECCPAACILVNTVHDEIWTLRKLLARDVNAIIYKSGKGDEVVHAIKELSKGNKYYCKAVKDTMKTACDSSQFPTNRELEVLYQIAQGKTSREIAASLFVSDNTVEAHRKSLFQKLDAVNVADLVVKAIAKGYINKDGEAE